MIMNTKTSDRDHRHRQSTYAYEDPVSEDKDIKSAGDWKRFRDVHLDHLNGSILPCLDLPSPAVGGLDNVDLLEVMSDLILLNVEMSKTSRWRLGWCDD